VVATGAAQAGWRLQLFCADATGFNGAPPPPLDPFPSAQIKEFMANYYKTQQLSKPQRGKRSRAEAEVDTEVPAPECSNNIENGSVKDDTGDSQLPFLDSVLENALRKAASLPSTGATPGVAPVPVPVPRGAPAQLPPLLVRGLLRHVSSFASPTARSGYGGGESACFDRVLVDAECTHDGSQKHLEKAAAALRGQQRSDVHTEPAGAAARADPADHVDGRLNDPGRLAALVALQTDLLRQGFRRLRPGGVLVYSTCSLSRDQNEGVVAAFLAETAGEAVLVPIANACADLGFNAADDPNTGATADDTNTLGTSGLDAVNESAFLNLHTQSKRPPWTKNGLLPGTVRFEPMTAGCGGMFVAKITRVK
jgi:hypothetical protein